MNTTQTATAARESWTPEQGWHVSTTPMRLTVVNGRIKWVQA